MIEEMAAKVPDMNKAIFNFHDPPKDSTLDTCPNAGLVRKILPNRSRKAGNL